MLDTIMQIIAIVGLIILMGTATYTLIASEIRARRIDKEYEDAMKKLLELREREYEHID